MLYASKKEALHGKNHRDCLTVSQGRGGGTYLSAMSKDIATEIKTKFEDIFPEN